MVEAPRLGYEQYEISNFAKPGCYAVHNTSYWQGVPYLGLGPSAHSFDGERLRQWNVANNALYIQSLIIDGKVPFEQEQLTSVQRLNEYVMTSLRTMWGCDLSRVEREWGSENRTAILEAAQPQLQNGRLLNNDNRLLLTQDGKLFADGIAADLFQS